MLSRHCDREHAKREAIQQRPGLLPQLKTCWGKLKTYFRAPRNDEENHPNQLKNFTNHLIGFEKINEA